MISKETVHRILLMLEEKYNNNTSEYFVQHPCNDVQHANYKYVQLHNQTGWQVFANHRSKQASMSYDVSDKIDISNYLYSGYSTEECKFAVVKVDDDNDVCEEMQPDNELFYELIKLYVERDSNGTSFCLPTDIIEIDGDSYTMFEVATAIDYYAEPDRLNKKLIIDRYVSTIGTDLVIGSKPRYSEEFIAEMEQIITDIKPYINMHQWSKLTYTDEDKIITWNDLCTEGFSAGMSIKNALWLCMDNIPPDLKTNIQMKINFVDYMHNHASVIVSYFMVRKITQSQVSISYKDVPVFQDFVKVKSPYVREIREAY